jgi:hypothetical protein
MGQVVIHYSLEFRRRILRPIIGEVRNSFRKLTLTRHSGSHVISLSVEPRNRLHAKERAVSPERHRKFIDGLLFFWGVG